jgi:hypothetical protein
MAKATQQQARLSMAIRPAINVVLFSVIAGIPALVLKFVTEGNHSIARSFVFALTAGAIIAAPFVVSAVAFGLTREFVHGDPMRKRWFISLATAYVWAISMFVVVVALKGVVFAIEGAVPLLLWATVGAVAMRFSRVTAS